jgi:hypothetical protein
MPFIIMTFSTIELSIMTFIIMTFIIMTLNIMAFSVIILSVINNGCHIFIVMITTLRKTRHSISILTIDICRVSLG